MKTFYLRCREGAVLCGNVAADVFGNDGIRIFFARNKTCQGDAVAGDESTAGCLLRRQTVKSIGDRAI